MGMKVLAEALIKHGKTLFAMSMSELGPMGFVDTEQRTQMYTRGISVEEAVRKCPWLKAAVQTEAGVKYNLLQKDGTLRVPFDDPRVLRDDLPAVMANPVMAAVVKAQNVIFLREVLDVQSVGSAIEMYGAQYPALVGQALDTVTDVWDQLQELKDPDPKKDRLAWAVPQRLNRRLLWAARLGGGHSIITAHLKPEWEKQGGELVKVGMTGAMNRHTPRWADVHLRLYLPDADDAIPFPHPKAGIIGEGTGGVLKKGEIIENPTFAMLVRRVSYMPDVVPSKAQNPNESEYRTTAVMRAIEGAPTVAADRVAPVAEGRK